MNPNSAARRAAALRTWGYRGGLTAVLVVCTAMLGLLLAPPGSERAGVADATPEVRLEGALLRAFDADGQLRYTVAAPGLQLFREQGQADITAPELALYDHDTLWTARAGHGVLTGRTVGGSGEDRLDLTDDVVLIPQRGQRRAELTTAALVVYPQRQWAETDQAVIISSDSGRTEAARLEGDLRGGSLKLFAAGSQRVATQLLPNRPPGTSNTSSGRP